MKLAGRDALAFFSKPDPKRAGVLLFGPDAMRVSTRRQEIIAALIGPEGEKEMRLTRLSGADLRKDATLLGDATREQSFFPGPRVAFLESATDAVAKTVTSALADWQEGDAMIVVTAGQLAAKSALRKAFETHPNAVSIGIYNDPPSRDEIESILKSSGLRDVDETAMSDLYTLARTLDPGDFRQTVEKLSLYKLNDNTPVASQDVLACAPSTSEGVVDDVLSIVAEARTAEIGPIMAKLEGQGIQPVTLCISATRHFRTLHTAASDPGGPSSGIARVRPPVFGPRRDQMTRQAQHWGVYKLETALSMLTDADLMLRSSTRAPSMAVMERTLIRLSMLGKR